MTLHTTIWSPDTCKCTISYEWDDELSATDRVHTPVAILKDCPEHSGLGDAVSFYNALIDENKRKNKALGRLKNVTDFPELAEIGDEGQIVFKNGVVINWSFTGSDDTRVLNVDLSQTPLSANQKDLAQTWADNEFGTGKVVIV
jgi:hypothetical protein